MLCGALNGSELLFASIGGSVTNEYCNAIGQTKDILPLPLG